MINSCNFTSFTCRRYSTLVYIIDIIFYLYYLGCATKKLIKPICRSISKRAARTNAEHQKGSVRRPRSSRLQHAAGGRGVGRRARALPRRRLARALPRALPRAHARAPAAHAGALARTPAGL